MASFADSSRYEDREVEISAGQDTAYRARNRHFPCAGELGDRHSGSSKARVRKASAPRTRSRPTVLDISTRAPADRRPNRRETAFADTGEGPT